MKNKILILGLICVVLAGCRVNRVTTLYESVTFAPKPENDSLWLFTPVLQFANFSESYDRLAHKELKSMLGNNLILEEQLRSRFLIPRLEINQKDRYIKSLQSTPVAYWMVCSLGSEKNDPFETHLTPRESHKQQAVTYIRIIEVASGKEVYKQKTYASLNKPNEEQDKGLLFIPTENRLHFKTLQKALKNLKRDMGK